MASFGERVPTEGKGQQEGNAASKGKTNSDVEEKNQQEEVDEQSMEEEIKMMKGNSDGESDDEEGKEDLSSDEMDVDEEVQEQVYMLMEKVSTNPFDYSSHVQLLAALGQCGSGVKHHLQAARECMAKEFPLTAELWLPWLRDAIAELEEIEEEEKGEREQVKKLFDRAVSDYLSPDLWIEYVGFMVSGLGDPGGLAVARAVCDRALTALSLHPPAGKSVWDACRELEQALLSTLEGTCGHPESHKAVREQRERVDSLYRRQLGLPLQNMDSTLAEYESWLGHPVDPDVRKAYDRAWKELQEFQPFEEALLSTTSSKLTEWQAYLAFLHDRNDPARIITTYERALVDNCLNYDLWIQYTEWLDGCLQTGEQVISAHHRATRNCPWVSALWQGCLRAHERGRTDLDTMKDVFSRALEVGFVQPEEHIALWETFLDFLRRRTTFPNGSKELEELREWYTKAVQTLCQTGSGLPNPAIPLLKHWARIEAHLCGNLSKARELWEEVLKDNTARADSSSWLEFYQLERECGSLEGCRRVLHRGVQSTTVNTHLVCNQLLLFEREHGSLVQWDVARERVQARLRRIGEQYQKEEERMRQKKELQMEREREKTIRDKAKKSEQRSARKRGGEQGEGSAPTKKQRGVYGAALPEEVPSHSPGEVKKFNEGENRMDTAVEKGVVDSNSASRTVFVSNLSLNLSDPVQQLHSALGPFGSITGIKLGGKEDKSAGESSNHGRQFRGFAYVMFHDEESVKEVLKHDRMPLDGRPMFLSRCRPPGEKRERSFKYNLGMEPDKVFISGLPFSLTESELHKLCTKHSEVSKTRIVTNRAGKSKGLAYVELATAADASRLVLALNDQEVGGRHISVAISQPPARRPKQSAPLIAPRGRARTQLALIPRSLHRQVGEKVEQKKTPNSEPASSSQVEGNTNEKPKAVLLMQCPLLPAHW
uniref:Spliceosome associated factor 3, U4/U6 recycling protein n=1 Tax=Eptatretus burgeri TaxID=7764 RepID=A0A8C4WR61_EPTBU